MSFPNQPPDFVEKSVTLAFPKSRAALLKSSCGFFNGKKIDFRGFMMDFSAEPPDSK